MVTLLLMCITSISGILSIDFTSAYSFINQYGQEVSIHGYGIYAFDSYFKASIPIGTDFCILFILMPMFLYTYIQYRQSKDSLTELKMISVYSVSLSLSFVALGGFAMFFNIKMYKELSNL